METLLTKYILLMRFLVLDDHPIALKSICQTVSEVQPDAEVIGVDTADKAKKAIQELNIDYAICDLQLEKNKNLEIPNFCRAEQIPYMVFSSHSNALLLKELHSLRALCVVNKSESHEVLKEGIRSLINKKNFLCPTNQKALSEIPNTKEIRQITFTKKQQEILDLLKQGRDQNEIADILHVSPVTIRNHLAILRNNNDCQTTQEVLIRYLFWE